jgi:hypothetical protein
MPDIEIAEQLERAADLIEERGWRQGPRANPCHLSLDRSEPICLIEAVSLAGRSSNSIHRSEGCTTLFTYLGLQATRSRVPAERLIFWNDDAKRTEGDVVDALRGCAKEIRNAS